MLTGVVATGGRDHAAPVRPLPAAGHHRLGLSLYFLFGNIDWLGKHDGIAGIEPISIFGISLASGRHIYFLIWAFVLLALLATRNLLNSRPGRAIRALKSGAGMAESMGVNTAAYKVVIFVWAALLACVSGWLYAHMQRAVSPSPFGINYGIEYLFMAVVGGAGYVWGALLGSTVILVLKDQLQNWLPKLLDTNANFEMIVFGVLLILMLQYARNGLWPIRPVVGWPYRRRRLAPRRRRRRAAGAPASATRPGRAGSGCHPQGIRRPVAVNDISFKVSSGEIMGLIGPNGAGKSTTFNLISGVLPVTRGQVRFMGERIDNRSAREIAKLGVGRTFQHVQLLPGMTVLENVALGAHLRSDVGVLAGALHSDRAREASCCTRRPSRSSAWAWASTCTSRRATWPWASSASWRSRARWPPIRCCCCWTNPQPACATRKSKTGPRAGTIARRRHEHSAG